MDKNKVILIGGNHHNGLGLVRSFGVNGVRPYGIIINNSTKRSFVSKSKYWEKVWEVKDDEAAIKLLYSFFSNEKIKPIIIPWSDSAAEYIDEHYNEISNKFITQSINGEQGRIVELMNKQKQMEFCEQYGISMLKSQILDLMCNIDQQISFPVILKPVMSVEGEKLDITICSDEKEFLDAVNIMKEKGYRRILVQQYLQNRKEYVLTGAVNESIISYTIISNVRRWPISMGCGSFSKFETKEEVLDYGEGILNLIQEVGYSGNIDLEFFEDSYGKFYLNEINWRSSGRNFVSMYTHVYSCFYYYQTLIGETPQQQFINTSGGYTMNESTDLRHVFFGDLSFGDWLRDNKQTHSYSLWYKKDLKPTIYQYRYLIYTMIKKKLHIDR